MPQQKQLSKTLKEQFTSYGVVLNELAAATDDSDAAYALFQQGFKAIAEGIGKLPCAQQKFSEGGADYELPTFELCEPDGVAEDHGGKLAWVVCLHSNSGLEKSVISAVKAFVLACFEEAARIQGGAARLSKVSVQSHYTVVEEEALGLEAI